MGDRDEENRIFGQLNAKADRDKRERDLERIRADLGTMFSTMDRKFDDIWSAIRELQGRQHGQGSHRLP